MQGALRSSGDLAVEILADFAGREPVPSGTALVVDEGGTAIADALRARGLEVTAWRRHAVGATPGEAWPPDGVFDLVVLRLPRGRETLGMLAHWLAPHIRPSGELWLAGRNDEGIRSAGRTLGEAFDEVASRDTRRHCRVLSARRPRVAVRSDPLAWRERHEDNGVSWVSWPGSFARGRVDPGTALLRAALPSLADDGDPFARTLDLGCGAGLLALEVARLRPGAALVGLDADALALEAARVNVPGLQTRCLDATITIGGGGFTAVVTNPPAHQGSRFDRDLTARVLGRAVEGLRPGGLLAAVALRGVPLGPMLAPGLQSVRVATENDGYRVWTGRKAP